VKGVCVGFVMCECFGNMCTCIHCVVCCLLFVLCFCIVSFMYVICFENSITVSSSSNNNNHNMIVGEVPFYKVLEEMRPAY
jgi:hypothetical protein